jgi:hypothetical protein
VEIIINTKIGRQSFKDYPFEHHYRNKRSDSHDPTAQTIINLTHENEEEGDLMRLSSCPQIYNYDTFLEIDTETESFSLEKELKGDTLTQ